MKKENLITCPITYVLRGFVTAATLLLALTGTAVAATDNQGSSNSTLSGEYAFTISGQTANPNGTTSVTRGIAMTTFDGAGKLTQFDFVGNDGTPRPGMAIPWLAFIFKRVRRVHTK
jgi:hypothetical protein